MKRPETTFTVVPSRIGNALTSLQIALPMVNKVQVKPFLRIDVANNAGECPIYLNISVNGEREKILLNFRVKPKDWNSDTRRVLRSNKSADELNMVIETFTLRITKIASDAAFNGIILSKDALLKKLNTTIHVKMNFADYIEKTVEQRTDIKKSSKAGHLNTAILLNEFKTGINIQHLTAVLMLEYKSWLEKKNYSLNTIHKEFRNLRTYYNLLQTELDIVLPDIFKPVKTKWIRSNRIALTNAELQLLKTHYEQIKYCAPYKAYIVALRYYLFSCHTGLRISDINNLSAAIDNGNWISVQFIKQKKGINKIYDIPLTDYAMQLWADIKNSKFENVSDPHKRSALKHIAAHVGIKKDMKYHTSRHTFATVLIQAGAPMPNVQKLLTHASITTTMLYSHVNDSDLIRTVNLLT